MINVQGAGGLLGPGQWIEVRGSAADFRYPAVTLTGLSIPNLETYGLGGVALWHILWGVLALAWVLWWIRRPLFLPRNALLERGEEDMLVTPLDRRLAAVLLMVTLVVVIVGFRWAEVSHPRTIPLQGGRVKLPPVAQPERPVALTLERATYDVPGRSMRLALKVTNTADQPIRLGELSTANVRFVNHDLPAAVARVDPGYPADLLARTGLRIERDEPIKPGESRVLQVAATDVAWETERLTSFLNDPDSRFGAMLFFYEPDGTRRSAMIGGPIIPTFVRS
jgi:methane/ammonia monooxygenase subunit B